MKCVAFLVLFLLLCPLATAAPPEEPVRDTRWAVPLFAKGLPNLHQVDEQVYRFAQPTTTGLSNAQKMGLASVLSLRASNKDEGLQKNTPLRLLHVPINTWDIGDAEVIAALRAIAHALKPVLVHCRRGADRTGVVMAMYRMVFQGWSKADAKKEMLEGGYGFHAVWANIPRYLDAVDVTAVKNAVLAP